MEYTRLTPEQREQLLEGTLTNIEQEHFSTTLARTRAEVSGDEELVALFDKQLALLDAQYAELLGD